MFELCFCKIAAEAGLRRSDLKFTGIGVIMPCWMPFRGRDLLVNGK